MRSSLFVPSFYHTFLWVCRFEVTGYPGSKKKNEPNQARFSGRGGGVQIASGRGFALGLKMLEKVSVLVQMWYKTSNKIA